MDFPYFYIKEKYITLANSEDVASFRYKKLLHLCDIHRGQLPWPSIRPFMPLDL